MTTTTLSAQSGKPIGEDTADGAKPIDMLLFCPECGTQHIDAPEVEPGRLVSGGPNAGRAIPPRVTWDNPPHRSHLCGACGTIWRPADVPTNGVKVIVTKGKADTWSAEPSAAPAADVAIGEREAFEAHMRSRDETYLYRRDAPGSTRLGQYCRQSVQDQWETWQARAALTAEKVAGQSVDEIRRAVWREAHSVCLEGVKWTPEPSKEVQFYIKGTCHRLAAEISSRADPVDGKAAEPFPYQRTFDAIAAATSVSAGRVAISVIDFRKAFGEPRPAQTQVALTDEQREDLQEAREILENMLSSVELDGNYSTEATCTFLRQALLCLPAAQPDSGGEA